MAAAHLLRRSRVLRVVLVIVTARRRFSPADMPISTPAADVSSSVDSDGMPLGRGRLPAALAGVALARRVAMRRVAACVGGDPSAAAEFAASMTGEATGAVAALPASADRSTMATDGRSEP